MSRNSKHKRRFLSKEERVDIAQQPPRLITPKQAQVTPLIEKYYPSQSEEKTSQYWVWNFFSRALEYLQHARSQNFSSKQASTSTSLFSAIKTSSFLFVFSRILIKYLLFVILSHSYKIIRKTSSRYIEKSSIKEIFEVLRNKIVRLAFSAFFTSIIFTSTTTIKDVKKIKTLGVD